MGAANPLVAVRLFALAQGVTGAAVLATGHAVLDHFDVDAGVLAPEGRLGAGTVDRQVGGADFDDVLVGGVFGHAAHGVSWKGPGGPPGVGFGLRPWRASGGIWAFCRRRRRRKPSGAGR